MPCPYANLFGESGKGFHSTRFMGLALYDTLGTIGLAWLTSYFFKISFLYSLVAWFVAGEVLHYVFGVKSGFLERIGLVPRCDA